MMLTQNSVLPHVKKHEKNVMKRHLEYSLEYLSVSS